ncbi:unnamed protein product [Fusarium graminearum]|uniref:Chromosome 1, complete genome n=1 Tax=Gibberella zeae (strain ATCC MYA-4620 / CBS 123657 / FGSC 9075 / NRRL 31084 / PH-1) TaxID=229533 RepID=I1RZR9_GIBZE|nr:hypothetical protein FGSG_09922 [Fusarium graminearum PH-1]ESU16567.1 hypothetical protein FGSG_09922 [Fusarium graminearum PH-1]EYB21590.1 hypothetical protein FG05_09922 [Fusarium graminearum]CEF75226.1 unnamed protein product [Fusarium graminearum]CZS78506.1 unnamed protein product [Fusarium graminearum]|eukprot:XP_011318829.1 hypothetical protein FGSG_09922 [Fusarium graminearum PH-1]
MIAGLVENCLLFSRSRKAVPFSVTYCTTLTVGSSQAATPCVPLRQNVTVVNECFTSPAIYYNHSFDHGTDRLWHCQGKEGQEKASNERAGLVPMQFTVIQCSTWSRRAGRIQIDTNQRHDTGMLTAVEVCLVSSLHVPGLGEPQLKDPHRSRNRSLVDADQRVIRS